MASGDVHNLVLVLHYQQQLPLEIAIKRAVNIHNQEIRELIELEASLSSFGEEVDAEIAQRREEPNPDRNWFPVFT